jgi:molybdate transport system ATP-binding protein
MLDVDIQFSRSDFKLDVQLQMSGQVLGILGDSGSGKSTLLSLINGLLVPQQGFIKLNDVVLYQQQQIFVPAYLRHIATVFQNIRLFPHLNVLQNLRFAYDLLAEAERRIELSDTVALLQLSSLLDKRPHELSGGEAQRVALGRSLLSSPKMLLLDEPLSSLDKTLKQSILPYLRDVQAHTQIPMLYVSHDHYEVDYLCQRVLLMRQGRLVAS